MPDRPGRRRAVTSAPAERTLSSRRAAVDEAPPAAPPRRWSDRCRAGCVAIPTIRTPREPARRLDRLDLALVVGFVLVAFFFRLWRLDIPRHTHFDEVYHARSATEWLSDWQEGWTRDTYEWTHPLLAKYLIAAGIVFADPNKVVGGTDLAGPGHLPRRRAAADRLRPRPPRSPSPRTGARRSRRARC